VAGRAGTLVHDSQARKGAGVVGFAAGAPERTAGPRCYTARTNAIPAANPMERSLSCHSQ
jgi:hypothetical protein